MVFNEFFLLIFVVIICIITWLVSSSYRDVNLEGFEAYADNMVTTGINSLFGEWLT